MNENKKFSRRTVLKTTGGLAGVQFAGTVSAESVNELMFVEAGLWHRFNDLPDGIGRVIVSSPVSHWVGREGKKLFVNSQTTLNSTLNLFRNSEQVLWAGTYQDLPATIVRDAPKQILVDSINDAFQSVTAVQTLNGYRPPKFEVESKGDTVTVSGQDVRSTLQPGERKQITLKERSVVVHGSTESGRISVRTTPVIDVANRGTVTVSEV